MKKITLYRMPTIKFEWLKLFILFVTGYVVYIAMEVHAIAFTGRMVGELEKVPLSLAGYSSLWMGLVGGIVFLLLGKLNEIKPIREKWLFIFQTLLGGLIITVLEFLSGLILNVGFGLHIWDYSHMPLNLLGQINIIHSLIWFLISPFAFWLDDILRWTLYRSGWCWKSNGIYNLIWLYKQLFNFKSAPDMKRVFKPRGY